MASNVSSDVRIVTSASASPSVTVTLPSETSTFHLPAPSTSKRYELFIPAVLPESTRASRPSKNSRVVGATGGRLHHSETGFGARRAGARDEGRNAASATAAIGTAAHT